VAAAGFVLKGVAEDNGAFGHTRIYGSPPCMRFTIPTHETPKRNFPVGGKNTLGGAAGEPSHSMSRDYAQSRAAPSAEFRIS
jgi:hypothetical protein